MLRGREGGAAAPTGRAASLRSPHTVRPLACLPFEWLPEPASGRDASAALLETLDADALQLVHRSAQEKLAAQLAQEKNRRMTDSTVRVWDYGQANQLMVGRHPAEFRCLALRLHDRHRLPEVVEVLLHRVDERGDLRSGVRRRGKA